MIVFIFITFPEGSRFSAHVLTAAAFLRVLVSFPTCPAALQFLLIAPFTLDRIGFGFLYFEYLLISISKTPHSQSIIISGYPVLLHLE